MKRHHCRTGMPRGFKLVANRPIGQSFDITGFSKPVCVVEINPCRASRKGFLACIGTLGMRAKKLDAYGRYWEVVGTADDMERLSEHRSVVECEDAISACIP